LYKAGKLSMTEARRAIADLVREGPTDKAEEALELFAELAAYERSKAEEEAEA
jgi:hypothetical protein